MTLASILRMDAANHRPLPDDSELVQAVAVLARAHQDVVRNRQHLGNHLRSLLREDFPAALEFVAAGGGPTGATTAANVGRRSICSPTGPDGRRPSGSPPPAPTTSWAWNGW